MYKCICVFVCVVYVCMCMVACCGDSELIVLSELGNRDSELRTVDPIP